MSAAAVSPEFIAFRIVNIEGPLVIAASKALIDRRRRISFDQGEVLSEDDVAGLIWREVRVSIDPYVASPGGKVGKPFDVGEVLVTAVPGGNLACVSEQIGTYVMSRIQFGRFVEDGSAFVAACVVCLAEEADAVDSAAIVPVAARNIDGRIWLASRSAALQRSETRA